MSWEPPVIAQIPGQKDLEENLTVFWKKWKWWILGGVLLIQGGIYYWTVYQLNHPAILPNEAGRKLYAQRDYPGAEKEFIDSASFGFRKEKPLLNLGLNYLAIGDYEESHRILENVIRSNRFYPLGYEADGFVLFQWGQSILDPLECDYTQAKILWQVSSKRFRYASILSFLQIISIPKARELNVLYREVNAHIDSLPQWQEFCKNPPPDSKSSDSSENPDGSNGPQKGDPNLGSPDMDKEGDPQESSPKSDKKSPSGGGKDKPTTRSEWEEKRAEHEKNRQEKKENLDMNSKEKGDLEEARKRMENSFQQEDYTRHKAEINIVTSVSEIEEAMKQAKW